MSEPIRTAPLRAGVGVAEIPVDVGIPMMGYGARTGVAEGSADPLHARALYLEGAGRALLIEADLCLLGVRQALGLRRRIAAHTGLGVHEIALGCIHTHSGPDTGLVSVLTGGAAPAHVVPIEDAIERAALRALAAAGPARVGYGRCDVHIGRNRRRADAATDTRVDLLRVDDVSGRPRALVYVYGCHPTALGHDNLRYSADWPGFAAREIAERLPGCEALFALGAHADVDPRTRGLLDLAIPDQSVGVSFAEVEALGREVGAAVARAAADIACHAQGRVGAASLDVELPVHGACAETLATHRVAALEALGLPPDSPVRSAELYAREREGVAGLSAQETRERLARVRLYLRDRSAPRIAGSERAAVEVQVICAGPLWLLALPLECLVDVGRAWRARLQEPAALVSIANGWLRYLPAPQHFEEPDAHQRYEILQSTFEPEAATQLLAAGGALAARLGARISDA